MNKQGGGNIPIVSAGISLLIAGLFAFAQTDEKKAIPDHTGFQSCLPCHTEKQSMWDSSGHGKAIRLRAHKDPAATTCSGCHSSKNSEAGNIKEENFHKVSCLACHSLQKTEYEHRVVLDPENLCSSCHSQRQIFWGKGARGIEDSRNFHSGVPCISCHMTKGNHQMKVLRPDDPGLTEKRLDTCTACHKDNNREARVDQIQEWQSTYDENVKPLLVDVGSIEEMLKKNPGLLDAALKSKFEDVKANLSLLESDGSRGFHNFAFSLEITSLASGALKEIKAVTK